MNKEKSKKIDRILMMIILTILLGIGIQGLWSSNKAQKELKNSKIAEDKIKKDEYWSQTDVDYDMLFDSEDLTYSGEFITSIQDGNTENEIIEKNELIPKSELSVKDRLKAKRVAENFIQAITNYDSENPNKFDKVAMGYIDKNVKNNIKNITKSYLDANRESECKKIKITEISSMEEPDLEGEDCVWFRVTSTVQYIDKYGQSKGCDLEIKEVKLLKDGENITIGEFKNGD